MIDKIKITHLYSRSMNIYGDRGNILALQKRVEWRERMVEIEEYNIGDKPNFADTDLFFFGGGQDNQQKEVALDLLKNGKGLIDAVEKGASLLSICGGMQLLAHYYQTKEGEKFQGLGLFDAYTVAGDKRFIGNVVVSAQWLGDGVDLVGFENHSGKTYANWDKVKPLGIVKAGNGNNGQDKTEGVMYKNAIGSYLHGSLLPKNPVLTDWLLCRAFEHRYGQYQLSELDDTVEKEANIYMKKNILGKV